MSLPALLLFAPCHVVLPNSSRRPAFTLSLGDAVIASFLAGPDSTTLPIKVLSSVRLGLSPKINALATLMILIVSLGVVVGWWLTTRRERGRKAA